MSDIRKVLLATINATHPQLGMLTAFKGEFPEVREFDYLEMERQGQTQEKVNQLFVEEVAKFRPDWIWFQLQNTGVITASSLRSVRHLLPRCVLTHWMGDCRKEVSDYLASICRETHITYIAAWGQQDLFLRAGAREVKYLQIGLDWHEDVIGIRPEPTTVGRVPDVVMCGNDYGDVFPDGALRRECMRALVRAGLDAGVVGSGWPSDIPCAGTCHVKEQIHVWRKAKVAVGVSNFNTIPLYYSDRQLISMASGTPLVCYHVPELEREFKDGKDCLFFKDPDELVAQVKRLLDSADLRRKIGGTGKDLVIRKHTWDQRVQQALPDVERVRAKLVAS